MNKQHKYHFSKELRLIMFGFGDDSHPRTDTVELVEDMVIEYLVDLLTQADTRSKVPGKLRPDDILFVLRKDPKKHARVEELLYMNEELKRARKAFEVEEAEPKDL